MSKSITISLDFTVADSTDPLVLAEWLFNRLVDEEDTAFESIDGYDARRT